jgi:hypothetical protein
MFTNPTIRGVRRPKVLEDKLHKYFSDSLTEEESFKVLPFVNHPRMLGRGELRKFCREEKSWDTNMDFYQLNDKLRRSGILETSDFVQKFLRGNIFKNLLDENFEPVNFTSKTYVRRFHEIKPELEISIDGFDIDDSIYEDISRPVVNPILQYANASRKWIDENQSVYFMEKADDPESALMVSDCIQEGLLESDGLFFGQAITRDEVVYTIVDNCPLKYAYYGNPSLHIETADLLRKPKQPEYILTPEIPDHDSEHEIDKVDLDF